VVSQGYAKISRRSLERRDVVVGGADDGWDRVGSDSSRYDHWCHNEDGEWVVSFSLLPALAVLDAGLTPLGLPPHITAATGMDAMVHATEAYTSAVKKEPCL